MACCINFVLWTSATSPPQNARQTKSTANDAFVSVRALTSLSPPHATTPPASLAANVHQATLSRWRATACCLRSAHALIILVVSGHLERWNTSQNDVKSGKKLWCQKLLLNLYLDNSSLGKPGQFFTYIFVLIQVLEEIYKVNTFYASDDISVMSFWSITMSSNMLVFDDAIWSGTKQFWRF